MLKQLQIKHSVRGITEKYVYFSMILVRWQPHNHQIFTEISVYLVDTDAKTLLT